MTDDQDLLATRERIWALKGVPLSFKLAAGIALGLKRGRLDVTLPDGRRIVFGGHAPGPHAAIIARDLRFTRGILTGGIIGVAETYMDGWWDTPNLTAMLQLFAANLDEVAPSLRGRPWARFANRIYHRLRPNTRAGSKRNITAHYDLGNAFYEKWLDPTMTYSSARFAHPGQPLQDAQVNKYRSLADQLDLAPDQHVLEIGSGWGGFAEYAAQERGARVTTITISPSQYDFAKKRMFESGLAERVDVRLTDYRDVEGAYDRVASIEMFEAVGEKYWPAYFGKIRDVLRPGGRAGLQVITIREDLFERYRRGADFIQRYIFPGGMLPSATRLKSEVSEAGLSWRSALTFGTDYADTLNDWGKRFRERWDEIATLGFDERFRRLWNFYLAYCEAGFRTGRIDVAQVSVEKA